MALKELYERKKTLAGEIRKLADLANDDDHEWSAENDENWEKCNSDFDEVQTEIEAAESRREKLARAESVEELLEQNNQRQQPGRQNRAGGNGANLECTDEHRVLALQAWLRNANDMPLSEAHLDACERAGMNPNGRRLEFRLGEYGFNSQPAWISRGQPLMEQRALSVGTDSAGAYTVPEGFVAELERTLLAFNGPRQVSRVIRTSTGNDLPWPTVNDTSNTGVLLAEAGSIGSSVDPTFGQKMLNAYKYSSKPILISEELLEDSAFNMGQVLPALLGERLGRIQAANHTTGTGSSQPNGVVTASTLGKTAASATAIAADELIDLVHSIDPAYRIGPSVGFMLHDGILLAIRKLKDADNQYLWQPGLQAGTPDRLIGFPYTINQNMQATVATATKTVLFGDFSKFIIRDAGMMRFYRLEELYRANDQVGFISFMRSDSECIQTAAIKHLIQA